MHENKIYTGIGSRETPKEILELMTKIGFGMAQAGWKLRSGHALGADQAFEEGAKLAALDRKRNPYPSDLMEIYLPWPGFEGLPKNPCLIEYIIPSQDCLDTYDEAVRVAAQFHPYWGRCNDGARKLHTRNVYQIAGKDLNTRTNFVVCWTKGGNRGGGTGQALRMAEYLDIPIFDLARCKSEDLLAYVNYGVLPS